MRTLSCCIMLATGLALVTGCSQIENPTTSEKAPEALAKSLQTAGTNCVLSPSGLISWWPGDGNADDIQSGNHGTLQNGTAFAGGMVSQAFSFDGADDYIRINNFSALDGLSNATFEFWINLHSYPADPQCNSGSCVSVLFSQNDFVFALTVHSSLAIEVSRGNGSNWGGDFTLSDGTLTGLNQWNHVAVVVEGTTDKVYINGVLSSSKTQSENALANFGGLILGAAYSGTYLFLDGELDEVSIYNRALSAAEIQAIFNASSAGKCKITTVAIDVKPGSYPNAINPRSKGKIPVAILTTPTFDAATVNPATVRFGRTGVEAAPVHSALQDVDGDGDTDLILHFNTQDTGIICGDTAAFLTGETSSGQALQGSDSIQTVGCK